MTQVSVVLPVYERSEVLPRAIKSVLDQSYDNIELIVVDDGSEKNLRNYIPKTERVKFIKHNENRGAPAARNTGIAHSSGDYIAFIDSDDEWMEDKIKKQVECIENSSEDVGVVYTGYKVIRDSGVKIGNPPTARGDIFRRQLRSDQVNPTSTVLVKSPCLDRCDGFRTDLPARQDYELWLRLSKYYKFEFVPEILVAMHTDGSDRITDSVSSRIRGHIFVLKEVENEASRLDAISRRKIVSGHYLDIAKYLHKRERFNFSTYFYAASISIWPFRLRVYAYLLLAILRISISGNHIDYILNIRKKLNYESK